MTREKLAIIIPTKDRPDKLRQFLESISSQEVYPVQIIIVDGGEISAEQAISKFPNLPIDYVKAPCSLTTQRNVGIKMLKEEVALVAFFDDDIVFEKNGWENMIKFWESASPSIGGAMFNNISDLYKQPTFFEKIFLVNTNKPGRIIASGFQSKLCSLGRTMRVQWLSGGITVWRKNIFDEYMFDEWFSGYARYEDVDFSYRVGKKYKLYIVAEAKAVHNSELERVEKSFSLGRMQVVNRLYFVKKNPELSRIFCYWALFGLFLNNITKGVLGGNIRYINRAKGNMAGFMESLLKPHVLNS